MAGILSEVYLQTDCLTLSKKPRSKIQVIGLLSVWLYSGWYSPGMRATNDTWP